MFLNKYRIFLKVTDQIILRMESSAPLTSLREGCAELFVPSEKVFYNPVQEFNRDLSIAVLTVFAKEFRDDLYNKLVEKAKNNTDEVVRMYDIKPEVRILEALSASGLRSIRYAKEVPNVTKIIANDMSEAAVNTMKENVVFNKVDKIVETSQEDACLLMLKHKHYAKRFAAVDLDPYGCPAMFLDSAVQCVQDGGLLLVTATDMAVLAGNSPESCYSKYGSISVKTKCCHEVALRILLQCISSHANRYGRYIVPLLSISVDFYVRVFVKIHTGPQHCKRSLSKLSLVQHCVGCDNIILQPLGKLKPHPTERFPDMMKTCLPSIPSMNKNCENCNQTFRLCGPIWSDSIHDESFVSRVLTHVEEHPKLFRTSSRMQGVLAVVREELHDVPLYYVMQRLFGSVHIETMPMLTMRSAILNAGYRVSYSHASKLSVKTDAPPHFIWDVVRTWAKQHPPKPSKLESNPLARWILSRDLRGAVELSPRADANPASRRDSRLRYQLNPSPNWGPGTRATLKTAFEPGQVSKAKTNQNKNKAKRNHSPSSQDEARKRNDVKSSDCSETETEK